ncbi:ribonuclease P protein subunit p38 [Lampris incognitus]|uniref:ribonuclease P protein subunit p38 n=1 Tax=Lampris incognitus TaxID=2546036 RepID=UPI0024B54C55|nr:ribonuclease P protein subunit p38 [Lampris incognitus]
MAIPGKLSKKELKRQIQAKTSLNSPYKLQWKTLVQGDMHYILKTLEDKLVSIGLEKKEVKVFRRRKKTRPTATTEVTPLESKGVRDPEMQDAPKNGWTDVTARGQLAIGINEVTRALEKNELKLVLVCKSVKPQHMTQHLIALSQTRNVPACQVPRLSECVSGPLGLKSVLALGFRNAKENRIFTDTVEAIIPKVPLLEAAWLHQTESSVTTNKPAQMEEEEEDAGKRSGRKRKLEGEPEEVMQTAPCTLQPLKVKKIIPNPSKKRIGKKRKTKK